MLILDQHGQLTSRLPSATSIEIQLGNSGWFHPSYVRQEGQDPIDLAILLDQNSPVSDLPRPLTQALSSFGSLSLTSRDHVSLFVMDCSSIRVTNIPSDPAQAGDAIKSAIEPAGQNHAKSTCKEGGHLWDTLAVITRTLAQSPSRRVILAITEGKDHGSVVTEKDLLERAESSAVTIFDLDPTYSPPTNLSLRSGPASNIDPSLPQNDHSLPWIAMVSGGDRFGIEPSSLRSAVRSVVTLLRERYVVQYRLPPGEKPGHTTLEARIGAVPPGTFRIRVTGNSIPLSNPAEADGVSSAIARTEAAPVTQPAKPVAAAAAEPAAAPVIPAPAVVNQPAIQAAANAPQEAAQEAASAPAEEPWLAGANAAMHDASVPTLKVDTRLTLVDVTVTDSKAHPVHGLTQADFTVKEDGKEQAIKTFEAFGDERPAATAAPSLPPDVYSNQQNAQQSSEAVNILLIDQVSTGISRGLQPSPEAIKYAKKAATQYLGDMPAGTRVAVMTTDGSGLHMLQDFTTDRDLLVAAVNSITFHIIPDARWEPAPEGAGPPPCPTANFQSQQALNALNQIALFLSSTPGRKNLFWFTPGIPWLADYPYFADVSCFLIDYTPQLEQVYGQLTAARVAVYPIDARGLFNDPTGEATRGGRPVNDPLGFSSSVNEDRKTLEDFAKATGGKAHYGENDLLGALRNDAATGADYYALSYVPPLSKYDGKYHAIDVKVDRPGVQLEYRRGYTSLDLNGPLLETEKSHGKAAPQKDSFQTAMGYGELPATQVVFAVRAVPADSHKPGDAPVIGSLNSELKGKPLVRYSFDFDLPRDKITLEEQPDGTRKATFELAIAAYDVQGQVLNSLDEKRSFTLKADAVAGFLQKPFVVPMEIDLPMGSVSVRAGVEDLPSEAMGVVEIPLTASK
jgi:VWFA-related protein